MGQNSRVRVLAVAADDFACGPWRILWPVRTMRDERVEVRIWQEGDELAPDTFDVLQLQRVLLPGQLGTLRMLKRMGKKIVVDYDDAFPLADRTHPLYEKLAPGTPNAAALGVLMSLADAITVPTPELVEHYRKMHRRVVLLPNAVDLDSSIYTAGRLSRTSEKLTVFWSGWDSHEANLRMVAPVIVRLLKEREDVAFAMCGPGQFMEIFHEVRDTGRLIHMQFHAGRGTGRLTHLERVPYEIFMRTASAADVVIAPLEQSAFNACKSEIRLIEAGAWGVPAVASAVAPYRRFEGGDGACLLVEGNDLEQWHYGLTRLLDDRTLREVTGRRARIAVETRYSLSAVNRTRAELWAKLKT